MKKILLLVCMAIIPLLSFPQKLDVRMKLMGKKDVIVSIDIANRDFLYGLSGGSDVKSHRIYAVKGKGMNYIIFSFDKDHKAPEASSFLSQAYSFDCAMVSENGIVIKTRIGGNPTSIILTAPDETRYKDKFNSFIDAFQEKRMHGNYNPVNTNNDGSEPDMQMTISDLTGNPLGIFPSQNPIWNVKFTPLRLAAEKIKNWKILERRSRQNNIWGFNIIGNTQYGKKKSVGFNRSYRSEPVFNVNVQAASNGAAWGNDEIETISYMFMRGIKGKVPKSDKNRSGEILMRPQWTEQEAKAFADAITADLAGLGIEMRKGARMEDDIYSMEGFDRSASTFYNVRILKTDNDLSANYNVILDICSPRSFRYKEAAGKH